MSEESINDRTKVIGDILSTKFEEIKIINSNQQLIQNFSRKIEDKINKIWKN